MATGAPQLGVVTPGVAATPSCPDMTKSLIFIMILGLVLILSGCGAGVSASWQKKVDELRTENARLEAQLTEASEGKLQAERNACITPAVEPKEVVEAPSADDEVPQLPVVKLGPEESALEEGPLISVRPAAPSEDDEEIPQGVRPVLKVRGQHEAWVYHRPVSASEPSLDTAPPSTSSSD